jgi:Xaa-Pro aminopeptidase
MKFKGLALIIWLAGITVTAGPLGFDKSEYMMRRQKLMEKIPYGIVIIRNSPVEKPNLDFLYLCGVKVPNAVLVLDGRSRESTLFYTTTEDYLKGEGQSPELATRAVELTGVDECLKADQLGVRLKELLQPGVVVYTPFTAEEFNIDVSTRSEWDGRLNREQQFAKVLKEKYPGIEVKDCSQTIWDLRLVKSQAEIEKMRVAGRIGAEAMNTVMDAAKPGMHEYELSALFEYECKRKGCQEMAFEVIISSAENHKYLHYAQHNRLLVDGDFLVVDAGPAWEDYDTDISISFPVNGKFTPRQKEIYEACKEVSLACLQFYKPGITGYEVGAKVKELMISKGYNVESDAFSRLRFFKEGGITHSVGLATHDCGGRDVPKNMPLKSGMVFACDVFATFPDENLGVRVENTVLITETGCENLSALVRR